MVKKLSASCNLLFLYKPKLCKNVFLQVFFIIQKTNSKEIGGVFTPGFFYRVTERSNLKWKQSDRKKERGHANLAFFFTSLHSIWCFSFWIPLSFLLFFSCKWRIKNKGAENLIVHTKETALEHFNFFIGNSLFFCKKSKKLSKSCSLRLFLTFFVKQKEKIFACS